MDNIHLATLQLLIKQGVGFGDACARIGVNVEVATLYLQETQSTITNKEGKSIDITEAEVLRRIALQECQRLQAKIDEGAKDARTAKQQLTQFIHPTFFCDVKKKPEHLELLDYLNAVKLYGTSHNGACFLGLTFNEYLANLSDIRLELAEFGVSF